MIDIRVEPFRSVLIRVTRESDFGVQGVPYDVVRDVPSQPVEIDLIGAPGTQRDIIFMHGEAFKRADAGRGGCGSLSCQSDGDFHRSTLIHTPPTTSSVK